VSGAGNRSERTTTTAPISEATGRLNTVPDSLYQVAEVFFA
jgi:hypothetical protein